MNKLRIIAENLLLPGNVPIPGWAVSLCPAVWQEETEVPALQPPARILLPQWVSTLLSSLFLECHLSFPALTVWAEQLLKSQLISSFLRTLCRSQNQLRDIWAPGTLSHTARECKTAEAGNNLHVRGSMEKLHVPSSMEAVPHVTHLPTPLMAKPFPFALQSSHLCSSLCISKSKSSRPWSSAGSGRWVKHSLHPYGVWLETGAEGKARGQAGITQCSKHHQHIIQDGQSDTGFLCPLGPGLGHQLLPALLHHLHPVLRRPGIPVSPHVCQVGHPEHPCCSLIPPMLFEPGLSSAVSPCFTSLSASPSSSSSGTLPAPSPARIPLPFLIPSSHTLLTPLWSWLDLPRVPHPTLFLANCGDNSVHAPSGNQAGKLSTTSPLFPKYLKKLKVQEKKIAKLDHLLLQKISLEQRWFQAIPCQYPSKPLLPPANPTLITWCPHVW